MVTKMGNPPREDAPIEPSLEAQVLATLGYAHVIGTPVPGTGPVVLAEDFLQAYPDGSPHREATEDVIAEFLGMDPTDKDYPGIRTYILTFLETQFGPPIIDDLP